MWKRPFAKRALWSTRSHHTAARLGEGRDARHEIAKTMAKSGTWERTNQVGVVVPKRAVAQAGKRGTSSTTCAKRAKRGNHAARVRVPGTATSPDPTAPRRHTVARPAAPLASTDLKLAQPAPAHAALEPARVPLGHQTLEPRDRPRVAPDEDPPRARDHPQGLASHPHLLETVPLDIAERHRTPEPREPSRQGCADAARSSGDGGDPAARALHGLRAPLAVALDGRRTLHLVTAAPRRTAAAGTGSATRAARPPSGCRDRAPTPGATLCRPRRSGSRVGSGRRRSTRRRCRRRSR